MSLPESYDTQAAEKKWQRYWEEQKINAWNPDTSRDESFVIDTPPPTVSGLLHMGHIFSYTQADFIARFQRMKGKNVFYPMGFDDNGLPTERLVEKVKKVRATDMSREAFIDLCEGVAEEARKEFRALFESVALSVDWAQEYSTISADSRRISQASFIDLMQKGQAYRKLQPMLWDPVDQTAIAQAEVEDKELPSFMNNIAFGVEGSSEKITIATTRPEMLAACVAVFYHPDDARYQHLKGKTAITPLYGAKVPVLADETVKIDKGTGLVMCCTFGDETDIHWWRTHNLPTRIILNKYGKLTEDTGPVAGLKAAAAREKMIELLKESGALLAQEAIKHAVKCAERSGAPLEILPTYQWFVKILDKKDALKEKATESQWHPAFMKIRIDQWIDGLSWDWCISRQRYFGVPFPVWYSKRTGEEGKILLADSATLPINPLVDLPEGYTRNEVEAEADVMDTWATSSVSPQLSSHWQIDPERHAKLFPADLRPQAHEIIRTWAFYTIVKSLLHENSIPWKHLMISGWCLAADKTKMSKSKGNVVTPVALIEEKGADAVRFWASTSKLGADTAFSEDVLKIGRKLVTKLWNAGKFASTSIEKTGGKGDISQVVEPLDRWIVTRLARAIETATKEFETFEYSNARAATEDFFWNDFCDNYLEMVKTRSYGEVFNIEGGGNAASAHHAITLCFEGVLRLFAPFVPHIADELYSHLFPSQFKALSSIHARGNWPKQKDYLIDGTAEKAGIEAVTILNEVRKFKADRNLSLKTPLEKVQVSGFSLTPAPSLTQDLKNVCQANEWVWHSADFSPTALKVSVDFIKTN